jgi:hypothetical protein
MLSVALSRVPAISRPAIAKDTITAGKFTSPPACGPKSNACGSEMPAAWSQPTR